MDERPQPHKQTRIVAQYNWIINQIRGEQTLLAFTLFKRQRGQASSLMATGVNGLPCLLWVLCATPLLLCLLRPTEGVFCLRPVFQKYRLTFEN